MGLRRCDDLAAGVDVRKINSDCNRGCVDCNLRLLRAPLFRRGPYYISCNIVYLHLLPRLALGLLMGWLESQKVRV